MKVVYTYMHLSSRIFLYKLRFLVYICVNDARNIGFARAEKHFPLTFRPFGGYIESMKDFDESKLSSLSHAVILSRTEETASTNDDLKAAARTGAPDYTLRIADRQLAGKGRLGRSFYSEGGLYMSILLPCREETISFLTPAAAVAVARAIEELTGKAALVKWVNDVYVDDRKVCGILAESVVTEKSRRIVLGIGVNLDTPTQAFPPDIRTIAGSISADRSALAAAILRRLFALTDKGDLALIRREYRELCFLVGREVIVHKENGCRKATVTGLTDALSLSVRYTTGESEDLVAGEISVRLFEDESR